MPMLATKEERKVIRDQFLADNTVIVNHIALKIAQYLDGIEDLKDKIVTKELFQNANKIERVAESIAWTLATIGEGEKPLQSVAGMFRKTITNDDSLVQDIHAMKIAMEILFHLEPVERIAISRNGHIMVVSNIYDKNLETVNSYLPLTTPSFQHKRLGNFQWSLTSTDALEKLARVPFRVIEIEEEDIPFPPSDDFSTEGIKKREQATKQFWRRTIANGYKDTPIYFSWGSDYRGRAYPVGYWLNPQGTELEKAQLELWNKKKLDVHGIIALSNYIASLAGLDKETDEKKREWFKHNEYRLERFESQSEEPHLYCQAVKAWRNRENPTGFMVEVDATQSQIQLLSILLKSKKIAQTCNVAPRYDASGNQLKADAWQEIADAMTDILKGKVYRGQVKRSAMILLYGAGERRIKQQLQEDFAIDDATAIYQIFMEAIQRVFPGMVELMSAINGLWNREWKERSFYMPDGFKVTMKPTGSEWVDFKLFGKISITAKCSGTTLDDHPLFVFVNLIHAIDSYIIREIVRRASFDLYTIHDAVRVHPNDAGKVQLLYKQILIEMLQQPILANFIKDLTGNDFPDISGDLTADDIIKSRYAMS